ncbi:hypothetical protein [Microcoleus sp. F4-D5]|uniref:hypothetical protein n=1 Tax=Microcoleus sp. F4-D5 TaxID=2818760 RepID=UPI002FD501C1
MDSIYRCCCDRCDSSKRTIGLVLIEEYHKCLKSGCGIEQRQLETGDGLLRLLGFLAVVAVRLLQLRTASRMDGAADACQFVPNYLLKVLRPAEACLRSN